MFPFCLRVEETAPGLTQCSPLRLSSEVEFPDAHGTKPLHESGGILLSELSGAHLLPDLCRASTPPTQGWFRPRSVQKIPLIAACPE